MTAPDTAQDAAPVPTPISTPTPTSTPTTPQRMPWAALGLLAAMGFILIAGETMPAGLLTVIAGDLGTSEGIVGQFISVWALGTVIVTIPAITLTRGMRRKPLLLIAITGLLLTNGVTALSGDVVLSLVSRFFAGAFTGVIWGMLAAYGRKISPDARGGLALSIVSVGAPAGLALGTPLGAWVGSVVDWRWSFAGLSLSALVVLGLVALIVPDAPGQPPANRLPLRAVLGLPGVSIVLAVIVAWMLAHTTVYTYIAPYLRDSGAGVAPELLLLVYGLASVLGIVVTALVIDRHPRALLHVSIGAFIVAGAVLLVAHTLAPAVLAATVLWGTAFGGSAAQLQSALTIAGGANSDVANSFLPVAFNLAIFAGGVLGAAVIGSLDGLVLPLVMIVLGCVALLLVVAGRRTAFAAR